MNAKKILLVFVGVLVLVFVVWTVSPFFYETEVSESMDDLQADIDDIFSSTTGIPGVPALPIQQQSASVISEADPIQDGLTSADEVNISGSTSEVSGSIITAKPAVEFIVSKPTIVTTGQFEGKFFHRGEGTVELIQIGDEWAVRFEEDFSVTNGPDLFVYFGNNDTVDTGARLGALKGSKGSQNYIVPAHIDPTQYNEIWVHCRAFSVGFAKATLQ